MMKKNDNVSQSRRWIGLVIALAAILTIGVQAAAAGELQVLFQLDPRLLGSTYGAPRWVTPDMYDVISGGPTYTIQAKTRVTGSDARTAQVSASWISADPGLVTISYNTDNTVALQISGQGETTVEATIGDAARTLYVTAAYYSERCTNLRVMVSLTSQPKLPAQTCSVHAPMRIHLPMLTH